MKRTRLAVLACTIAVVLAAWVAPARGQAVLRLGVVASVSDAGFFVAQEKGYFAEAGLAVEFVPFQSAAQMIAPLGVGQLDAGGGGVSAGLFNAMARGVDLRIVADKGRIQVGYGYEGLVIRRDLAESGRFKSLADLRGLRIALATRGASAHVNLSMFARSGNINVEDIEIVTMGFPDMAAALVNKAIDGALLIEPFKTLVVEERIAV